MCVAAGCFWHVQKVFDKVDGVIKTRVGYTGGTTVNPTYQQVCAGTTGHAEAIEILYDSQKISYEELLDIFWEMHDPTTRNRQGADIGSQYRSAIFYSDDNQKAIAEESKQKAASRFKEPIVTEIKLASPFYEAEAYHQKYLQKKSQ